MTKFRPRIPHLATILLMTFLLVGCGLKTKKQINDKDKTIMVGVSVEQEFMTARSSDIRVVEGAGSTQTFGPALVQADQDENLRSLPVVALMMGPGLYRGFLHINVLKAFERHQIAPNVFTGAGMGAVIASLYAFSLTPDLIEWRVFNFLSEVENIRPYSASWFNKMDEILLKDLGSAKIEDAQRVLRLPVYNQKTRAIEMKTRGNLREILHAQFMATPSRQRNYLAPYLRTVYGQEQLRAGGVDFIIAIDALGASQSFNEPDDFWSGVWGRTIGFSDREKEKLEALITLPTQGLNIDERTGVSRYLEKTLVSITDSVGRLKIVLEQWERPKSSDDKNQPWYEFDQDFFIGENDELN